MRRAVELNKSTVMVNLVRAMNQMEEKAIYRLLGRLVAELIDEHAGALVVPVYGGTILIDSTTRDRLRADDVVGALKAPG